MKYLLPCRQKKENKDLSPMQPCIYLYLSLVKHKQMTKKILFTLMIALPAVGLAQTNNFTVKGKIGNGNAPAKAYLSYRAGDKSITDSTVLVNGAFEFTGIVAEPTQGAIYINAKGDGIHRPLDYASIYVDKGITMVNSPDSAIRATITGTKINEESAAYKAALKPVYDGYNALEAKEKAASPDMQGSEAFKKNITAQEKALDKQENAITRQFIIDNPNSLVSLTALRSYTYSADYVDVEPLFHKLSLELQNSTSGKGYAAQLEKLKGVAMGKIAPEFAMADTSGKMVSLSAFRGKYLLVDFWASWCGPCRQENPNVVKAFNQYKDKNFTILSVSLDRPNAKDKWMKAIHKDNLTWTHISDLKFWNSEAAQLYGVQAIPQNFLLDPNGKIIGKNLRGEDLVNKLNEVLNNKKNSKAE